MQLMPATQTRFGVVAPPPPPPPNALPIRWITSPQAWLTWPGCLDEFDRDLTRVIAAYNAGE